MLTAHALTSRPVMTMVTSEIPATCLSSGHRLASELSSPGAHVAMHDTRMPPTRPIRTPIINPAAMVARRAAGVGAAGAIASTAVSLGATQKLTNAHAAKMAYRISGVGEVCVLEEESGLETYGVWVE